jgi:hypothetical protein
MCPMKDRHHLALILTAVLAALPAAVLGYSEGNPYGDIILNREPEFDYDDSLDKAWEEAQVPIPKLYDEDDLAEAVVTEVQEGFSVLVDKKQLSIGDDGVLRYWVVLRSEKGAVNAMYEGLRCSTSEYKTYAFAVGRKKNRKVKPMPNAKWQEIKRIRGPNFRWELMRDYFCFYGRAKPVEQILYHLEAGPDTFAPREDVFF